MQNCTVVSRVGADTDGCSQFFVCSRGQALDAVREMQVPVYTASSDPTRQSAVEARVSFSQISLVLIALPTPRQRGGGCHGLSLA